MAKNPLHPPEDLDHDKLFESDPAAAIAVAIWENGTFQCCDWYFKVVMDFPGRMIKVVYDNPEGNGSKSKFVTFEDFKNAADKIISGEIKINENSRKLIEDACRRNEMGQWDVYDMDCVAQVAIFGDTIYG